jgi:hypothetical protein
VRVVCVQLANISPRRHRPSAISLVMALMCLLLAPVARVNVLQVLTNPRPANQTASSVLLVRINLQPRLTSALSVLLVCILLRLVRLFVLIVARESFPEQGLLHVANAPRECTIMWEIVFASLVKVVSMLTKWACLLASPVPWVNSATHLLSTL